MDDTPNLALPYIAPQQAQKHVTHNEAIRALDALVQLSVIDRTRTNPPETPADGARHIIAAPASGAWTDGEGRIAAFQDGAWMLYAPRAGWRAWCEEEAALLVFDGTAWNILTSDEFAMLGVNATADATNRLTVSSPSTLLNNEGAGHQLKINKAAAGDTASLLYQTAFSGRAEMGLAGDDDFSIKVSPDGSAFFNALVVDRANGHVGVGAKSAGGRFEAINSASSFFSYSTAGQITLRQDGGARPRINIIDSGGFGEGYIDFYTYTGQAVPTCRWQGIDTGDFSGAHVFLTSLGGAANAALAERLRIAANGRVGIGIPAPVCALDVNGPVRVASYAKAALPSAAAGAGQIIYVSDEAGGATIAFSDGANWRRVSDRAVVA